MRARGLLLTFMLGMAADGHAADEQEPSRYYFSAGLGWSYAEPFVIEGTNGVIDYDFNPSVGSLAAGVNASDNWRFEVEASLQDNAPEVWYFRGSDVELDTLGGDDQRATSFLLNAYRDFLLTEAVRPYLGLGIGATHVKLRFIENDPISGYENPLIDDSTWAFAYQAIAGLNVPLGRGFGLGFEYRYWRALDVALESLAGDPLKGDLAIHSGWLRLNYRPGGNLRPSRPDAPVHQGSGFYVSGTLGMNWGPDRDFRFIGGQFDAFDIGPVVGIATGYQFAGHWRLEAGLTRHRNEMEIYDTRLDETRTKGRVVGDTLGVNVGYRFRPDRAVDPFLSLGLGVARIRYDLDIAADRSPFIDDTVHPGIVQWQLGVNLALSSRWTITADYRGVFSEDFTLVRTDQETVTTTYLMHAMTIGARYWL